LDECEELPDHPDIQTRHLTHHPNRSALGLLSWITRIAGQRGRRVLGSAVGMNQDDLALIRLDYHQAPW
jgi:hypothetical protein